MRAERRLGQVLDAAKAAGLFTQGRQKKAGKSTDGELSSRPTLAEAGIDKKLSVKAQKRASIAERAFELMVQQTRERLASDHAKPINGQRSVAPGRQEPKGSLDYFPTPPWATRALVDHVMPALGIARLDKIWEPACGAGHMAEALAEYAPVAASDIAEYGYGEAGVDFLKCASDVPLSDWIITNPPFGDQTEAFVLHALPLARVGVAMFVRLQWLETVGRYEAIFRDNPPTLIAFFAERVNLCKGHWDPDGGTATAYIWLVWVKDRAPQAPFWIPPGCKEALKKPDDIERFTAHPVIKAEHVYCDEPFDKSTGEIVVKAGPGEMLAVAPIDGACCERDQNTRSEASESDAAPSDTPNLATAREQLASVEDDQLEIPEFLRRKADNPTADVSVEAG